MPKRDRYRDQELLDTFGTNLRRLRTAQGFSQEAFAAHVDLHRTYISHVERAAVNLSLGNAVRIADGLGTTVLVLLEAPASR